MSFDFDERGELIQSGGGFHFDEAGNLMGSQKPPAEKQGDFARGAKASFQQLPQLGYGILAGAGAGIEAMAGEGGIGTGMKKAGIAGYKDWGDKIAKDSKESDSWDYSYDQAKQGNFGALVDWLQHGIGYVGGQAIQTLATGGIGAVGGKFVAGTAAKQIAEGMVAKEAAAIGASEAAKSLSAQEIAKLATTNVANKFATIGQNTAVGASALGMEGGEIFGDLASKNADRSLTGSELGKAFAATLAAGGLEFVGDKVGLDIMLGKSALLKPAAGMTGLTGRAARGAIAGGAAAPIEGGTEYGQTLLEEFGKGNDPFSPESLKQASDSAALGILGGTVVGGAGGALRGPQAKKPEITDPIAEIGSSASVDEAITKAADILAGTNPQPTTLGTQTSVTAGPGFDVGSLNAPTTQGILSAGRQANDQTDLDSLIASETRDLQVMRANAQMEQQKQAELDQIQSTGTGQYGIAPEARPAVEQAATVEAPTAMQLALEKARLKAMRPTIPEVPAVAPEAATPVAPQAETAQPHPNAQPGDITRNNGIPYQTENGARLRLSEVVKKGGSGEVVQIGEGAFVVRPKEANAKTPETVQVQPQQQATAPDAIANRTDATAENQPAANRAVGPTDGTEQPNGALAGQSEQRPNSQNSQNSLDNSPPPTAASVDGTPKPETISGLQDQRLVAKSKREDLGHLGRDSVPLTEGGKPFKTNKAAKEAKKNQPTMRVIRVEGGFALAPKTEAQIAAEARNARRLAVPRFGNPGVPLAAHEFVASRGGLRPNERSDMGIQGNVRVGNRFLFAGTTGMDMDSITEALKEAGYLRDGATHDDARNLIKRSLNNPQYTPEGTEKMAEREIEAQRAAFEAEQEAIAAAQEAEDNELDMAVAAFERAMDEIPKGLAQSDMSMEDALLVAGYTQQEIDDERSQNERAEADQSPAEAAPRESAQSDREREGAQSQDSPAGSEEGLTSPTRADVLKQQADAEAEAKRKEDGGDKPLPRRELTVDVPDMFNPQGSVFDQPAEAPVGNPDTLRAQADLQNALADLADIFGKNTRATIMPEQEQKMLPVLVKLFDAAFRLGYHKFKDAAKFALDQIRAALGNDAADSLTLEHLQGAYISMSSGKTGVDNIRAVSAIEAKSEIESHTASSQQADKPAGQGTEQMAQADQDQRYEDHLAAQQEAAQNDDFDPFDSLMDEGFDPADIEGSGYNEAADPIKLEVNALLAQAEAMGIDTDTIKEQAYEDTRNGSEQDYYEATRAALQAAIEGSNGNRSEDTGTAGNAGEQGANDSGAVQGLGEAVAPAPAQKLEAGQAEIDEARALQYKTPDLARLLADGLSPTDAFEMHLLANSLKVAREYNRMMTAHKGDFSGIEFSHPEDPKYPNIPTKYAFVLPDASQPGKWRISYFDKNGFSRHESEKTRESAQVSLVTEGYTIEDKGALDRLAATKEWAKGTAYADLIMKLNKGEITHAQFIEAQQKLNAGSEEGVAKPLYASRSVTNADDIIAWATSQGFKTTLPADDMHVTVAYSSQPVDGTKAGTTTPAVSITGGKRSVEPLGDEGAIVLKFTSDELQARWKQYRDAGASWDYEGYTPHVTLTYDGKGVDLSKVKPYEGPIQLGAEKQEALNEDKADEYVEEPTLTAPTREEVLAQQERAEKADRAEKAQKKAQDLIDKKEQERKDIAARSVGAADSFVLGGDAEQNLTGQGGMFDQPAAPAAQATEILNAANITGKERPAPEYGVAQPSQPAYSGAYETDLFGNQLEIPVPSGTGVTGRAGPDEGGLRGNVQPKSRISDTPAPSGDYYVNTLIASETKRELGASLIRTPVHAAQATQYLYKSAVERFDGIVTDKNGKPLAVVGGFKGAISQASVYPGTIMAEAIRIPGAANIWFSHNHPSGKSMLSAADKRLNETMTDVFRGSGIEPMGLLAVAGNDYSYVDANGSISNDPIPAAVARKSVPVMERQLADSSQAREVFSDPASARQAGRALYAKAKEPGIMLMDAQMGLAAWIPITKTMMGPLRGTGGAAAVYRAVSQSNASNAIIIHGGELDYAGIGNYQKFTPSENIAAALRKVDVSPLDSINVVTGKSQAEQGRPIADGPMFSRADNEAPKPQNQPTGTTVANLQAAIKAATGVDGFNKLGRIVATTAADIKSTWEPLIGYGVNLESQESAGKAQAFYDPKSKTVFLIADNIREGDEAAVLAHELIHKWGKTVLGEEGWNRLHDVINSWKDAPTNSDERTVYDYARRHVEAVGMELSSEEMFPYAVEAAIKMGIKPSMAAKKGTVARWLESVKQNLAQVWAKITGKPETFKAQDLVNLAFGIAQMENPEMAGVKDALNGPAARTDTPAFKAWFGDSKVVDADGKPLVVYHGTTADFNKFDPAKRGSVTGVADAKEGFFFAASGKAASEFTWKSGEMTGNVMPVYLSMQNPMRVRLPGEWAPRKYDKALADAKAAGHDGLIVEGATTLGTPGDYYIAFRPEQIKSATGNNGNFDGSNPDIRYSRSTIVGQTLQDAGSLNNPRGLVNAAVEHLNDRFNAPGTLNWWQKSIGTQYDLAQRSKPFKKVFDSVQNFINDTSYYATEAADLAPKLVPKLESWKDIVKKPISSTDSKAIATPIFEGTLIWGRDDNGKLTKVTGDQPAGVVFTNQELKTQFGLTPEQIELYREFRTATDKSLTNLVVSHMVKLGGADVTPIADMALQAKNATEAGEMLSNYLVSLADNDVARSDVLMSTAAKVTELADKANDLTGKGYAPLSRFGHYTVDVISDGQRVYFGMFESKIEANQMAKRMQENYPKSSIRQGTVSEEEYKLFAGVTPETLELFGEMLGLDSQGSDAKNQVFQEYLKAAKSNRSAMKRLIHRKGIAGFSEDASRVLAGFIYSNARQTSANLHAGEITKATSEIPQGQGEVKDAAIKLATYVQNPQEEAQALRGLMFAQYIGGSVASAMVNLTQPFTMTLPWLSQYGGIAKAGKQMAAATRDALKDKTGDAKLDAALKHAEEEGIVSPQEVHQLQQQASGAGSLKSGDGTKLGDAKALASNSVSRVMLGWGKLFGVAEQFNRRSTFIAAYRTAVEQGMDNPAQFAERAIAETQGIYNKGNKPAWARGAIGSTLFTFKQFSIAYVEMLGRMVTGPEANTASRMAALNALAILVLVAGVGGLPGADDLDDLISGILQSMGYNFDSKAKRRAFLMEHLGAGGQRFVEHGLSGLPGVPIDVSGRLGLGNLVPGTGLFTKKKDHTSDVAELAGPAGDLFKRGFQAGGALVKGDVGEAVNAVAPMAARNVVKAFDMANMGMYRDQRGNKVIDTDMVDAVFKGIGFQPAEVKQVQDATGEIQRMVGLNKMRESEIADKWAQGLFEKNPEKAAEARQELLDWNAANPDMRIKIDYSQIFKRLKAMNQTKQQRIEKTAPREIRAAVRQELMTQ